MATDKIEPFDLFLTVSDAAAFLGVSPSTLRNWDRQGKLSAFRNPLNSYRLYRREDLERLLADIRRKDTKHGEARGGSKKRNRPG